MICSDAKSRWILNAYDISNNQDRNQSHNARDRNGWREHVRHTENYTNRTDRPPHKGTGKSPAVKPEPTTPAHRNINGKRIELRVKPTAPRYYTQQLGCMSRSLEAADNTAIWKMRRRISGSNDFQ